MCCNRERAGDYLGGTVQIIPHITGEIKRNIYSLDTPDTDVAIVEIGGTVGDIESQPFLESIRQVAAERGRQNVMFIHVSLIVSIPGSGELKSKPTQHSAKELLESGHSARCHHVPLRRAHPRRDPGEDFPVLQHPPGKRHPQPDGRPAV